ALDGELVASLLKGRKSPLKAALLDQRLIAGLGNIYVSEALWRAGLSPLREAGTIANPGKKAKQQRDALAEAIRAVIADAIAADYMQTDGSLGYFQHSFAVYDREGKPCSKHRCGGHIERIVQSGRSTFYCRTCQL
ncbi:MAG: DNA-formamidopyrimidine glycosylase, partial [Mesorhizobium sp.]